MVYILLGTGFEETEAIAPLDLLRRAGVQVMTVGISGKKVCGGHGICVEADIPVSQMDLTQMDMIVLPGGLGGVQSIKESKAAMDAISFAWENGKFVAAICAGPTVLAQLGITGGKKLTCYPGCEQQMPDAFADHTAPCVRDGNLITGASAGCAVPFGLMLVAALKGEKTAKEIEKQIVIR